MEQVAGSSQGELRGQSLSCCSPAAHPTPYTRETKKEGERGSKWEKKRKERSALKSERLKVLPTSWVETDSHTLSNLPWNSRSLIQPWSSVSWKERDIQKSGLGNRDSSTGGIPLPFCQSMCWDAGRDVWRQTQSPKVSRGAERLCALTWKETSTSLAMSLSKAWWSNSQKKK